MVFALVGNSEGQQGEETRSKNVRDSRQTGGIVKGRQTYNDLQLTGGIVFVFGGR